MANRTFRTVKDLPKEERKPFMKWLQGQTVPVNDDGSVGSYEYDYKRWKVLSEN